MDESLTRTIPHLQFGPWSTSFSYRSGPQLSAFWKQRIGRLPSVIGDRFSVRQISAVAVLGAVLLSLPILAGSSAGESQSSSPAVGSRNEVGNLPGKIYLVTSMSSAPPETVRRPHLLAVDPNSGRWEKITPFENTNLLSMSKDSRFLAAPTVPVPVEQTSYSIYDLTQGTRKTFDAPPAHAFVISPDGKELLVTSRRYEVPQGSEQEGTVDWHPKHVDGDSDSTTWVKFNLPIQVATFISLTDGRRRPAPIPDSDEVWDWSADGDWYVSVAPTAPIAERDMPAAIIQAMLNEGTPFEVFVMRADGSERRQITTHGGNCVRPIFSPDAERIAFMRDSMVPMDGGKAIRRSAICVINRDGKNEKELLVADNRSEDETSMQYHFPAWSPDGRWLVISTMKYKTPAVGDGPPPPAKYGLVLVEVDGDERLPLVLSEGVELQISQLEWQ